MKDFIFYFPFDSNYLATYIAKGIIFPRKYISSSIKDIQSINEDNLILTKKKWVSVEKSKNDCCIELVLTEVEIGKIQDDGDFLLLNDAIPVSRVRSIIFLNEEQKKKTIYNVEHGDGFVPDIATVDKKASFDKLSIPKQSHKSNEDLSSKLLKFDKLLGAFALMRLAGRISNEYDSNFSEHYFSTLGSINSIIETECQNSGLTTKSNLLGIFHENPERKWNTQFLEIIREKSTSSDEFAVSLEKYASANNSIGLLNVINSSVSVKWNELREGDSYSIALGVIHRYGKGKRKSLRDLFNDILSGKIPFSKKIESLLFLYGYHYGYSTLDSSQKIKSNNEPIKFELNSQLDYFTIESIYQWIFKDNPAEDYEFLDWVPKYKSSTNTKNWILDVPVYGIKDNEIKKGLLSKIKEQLLDFFLEGDKLKYDAEIIKQLSVVLLQKLDFILSDITELEKTVLLVEDLESENKKLTEILNRKSNSETRLQVDNDALKEKIHLLEREKEILYLQLESSSKQVLKKVDPLENKQLTDNHEITASENKLATPASELLDNEVKSDKDEVIYDDEEYNDYHYSDNESDEFQDQSFSNEIPDSYDDNFKNLTERNQDKNSNDHLNSENQKSAHIIDENGDKNTKIELRSENQDINHTADIEEDKNINTNLDTSNQESADAKEINEQTNANADLNTEYKESTDTKGINGDKNIEMELVAENQDISQATDVKEDKNVTTNLDIRNQEPADTIEINEDTNAENELQKNSSVNPNLENPLNQNPFDSKSYEAKGNGDKTFEKVKDNKSSSGKLSDKRPKSGDQIQALLKDNPTKGKN